MFKILAWRSEPASPCRDPTTLWGVGPGGWGGAGPRERPVGEGGHLEEGGPSPTCLRGSRDGSQRGQRGGAVETAARLSLRSAAVTQSWRPGPGPPTPAPPPSPPPHHVRPPPTQPPVDDPTQPPPPSPTLPHPSPTRGNACFVSKRQPFPTVLCSGQAPSPLGLVPGLEPWPAGWGSLQVGPGRLPSHPGCSSFRNNIRESPLWLRGNKLNEYP